MEWALSAQRGARAVLPTTAALLPSLVIFAPLGTAPVLVAAALAMAVLEPRRSLASLSFSSQLAILLAALGLWGVASSFWSIIPEHSALEGLRFLAESACGLFLLGAAASANPEEQLQIGKALAGGLLLALLLLGIERFGGEPITRWWHQVPTRGREPPLTRFDRGVTVLVLLVWPLAFAEIASVIRATLILAIFVAACLMLSTAALTAAVTGFVVFALARVIPRFVAAAMIIGLIGIAIGIPFGMPSYQAVLALHHDAPWIKDSGIHRLLIWRFGADRIAERPLLGWGMDSSRAIPGGQGDFNTLLPTLDFGWRAQTMPLHPHDAALQWQLELGMPGLVLGLAAVVWLIIHVGMAQSLSPTRRAGALALVAASLVISLLSFGIWQSWWLSTLWLAAGLFTALDRKAHRRALDRRDSALPRKAMAESR